MCARDAQEVYCQETVRKFRVIFALARVAVVPGAEDPSGARTGGCRVALRFLVQEVRTDTEG
jgi:hypothetical protein